MYGFGGYGGSCCVVGRVGLGQVPGPGGPGTLRPFITRCCSFFGVGAGVAIIFIAILILVALGVIF